MQPTNKCIYCGEPADTKEHPLPAAFGEFEGAPYLQDRICRPCNNARLGILDEQLARCGPEGFFRRHYGVRGRANHDKVNPFYRGSAGGHRLDMKARDSKLGIDVLLECENGVYRQARQLIFVEESGRVHHLPIREDLTHEQMRAAFEQLGVDKPFDVHFFCNPEEKASVEDLIKEMLPSAGFGEGGMSNAKYDGAVVTVELTDRYFRAVAKIGFHYFLTQFPEYTGHESIFSDIRQFILEDGQPVDRANEYVGKREHPLLGEMLTPGARPDGWQAHVLCAEIRPGECLAHVQTFVSEDWPAPAYTIRLACDSTVVDSRAFGHAYIYFLEGPKGKYTGEALDLTTSRADHPAPPVTPVIT